MFKMWIEICVLLVCICGSVYDIRTRKIPYIILVSILGLSILEYITCNAENESFIEVVFAIVPGAILCALSWICKGRIGLGDGLAVISIGIGIGIYKCIAMLMIALFLNAFVAGILLAFKKVPRDYEIPFLPFISIGYLISMFGEKII